MADCTFPLSVGEMTGSVDIHADPSNPAFAQLGVECDGGSSTHAAQISLEDSGRVHLQANVFPGMKVTVVHDGQVSVFE
jgi:hypothetical protein